MQTLGFQKIKNQFTKDTFTFSGKILAVLTILFFFSEFGFAQTKGLIVQPAVAGKLVLDPDGDGYVSKKNGTVQQGFLSNDETESEISYRAIPLPGEPLSDLLRGPKGGFTDFSFTGTNLNPVYTYTSAAGNLMFRFRLGGVSANSKGYSILIDTDNKFGQGIDPNYTAANPGFEVEIVLATNFGVYLYNVDGVSNPSNTLGTDLKVIMPFKDYAQKAIAYTTQGGNADYFYDFYIPFSVISAQIPGFTATTQVRMVANTVMAPHSALKGPISDIGGVNDQLYSNNIGAAWTSLVNGQVASTSTTTTSTPLPPVRSNAPVVNSPILPGTPTISGTSTEVAGSVITLYRNGVVLASNILVSASGTWSYTVPAGSDLLNNDKITATVLASGKSESNLSNEVIVRSTCIKSSTPVITCGSDKGFEGNVPGAAAGTVVNFYRVSNPNVIVATVITGGTGTTTGSGFLYKCNGSYTNCTSGQGCVSSQIGNGTYIAIATESGKCASGWSNPYCVGTNSTTATPTVQPTSINSTTNSLSGTGTANSIISILVNDYRISQVTVAANGTWSATGLSFSGNDVVSIFALTPGTCASTVLTYTVLNVVSAAPVVSSPIYTGATSVSGTSTEAAGTTIKVYRGATLIGTTTVDAYGSWTLSGLATSVLTTGSVVTAYATATNKSESLVSNSVTVIAKPAQTTAPVITGTYKEGDTSVSGTSSLVNGTVIRLYIDGYEIGTTTVNNGTWTVSGLSAANFDLYAGGILNATAQRTGLLESVYSNSVTVACVAPLDKNVTTTITDICVGNTTTYTISNTQSDVIYSLTNADGSVSYAASQLGNSGTLTLTTYTFTDAGVYNMVVRATKAMSTCTVIILTNKPTLNVNAYPLKTSAVTAPAFTCYNTTAVVSVASTQSGFSYQLKNQSNGNNIGSPVLGNGDKIDITTANLTATTTIYVEVTDVTKPSNCTSILTQTVTITNDCPSVYTVETTKYVYEYSVGDVLATVTDPDGAITAAMLATPPPLPAGTALNPITGEIYVTDPAKLAEAAQLEPNYTLNIRTTDNKGGQTTQNVLLSFNTITPLPVKLLSFTAKPENNQVLLNWNTASEENNMQFEIERSTDGKTFEKIGVVKGNGTVNYMIAYKFTDMQPKAGVNYYRLKQVDYNLEFELSKVVVANTNKVVSKAEAFPNPSTGIINVQFELKDALTAKAKIVNATGQILKEVTVNGTAGSNIIQLDLTSLQNGLYIIKIEGENFTTINQIIKN